jgi:hypothetical protein
MGGSRCDASRDRCVFFCSSLLAIFKNGDERSTGKRLMLEINGGSRRDAPDVFIIIIRYYYGAVHLVTATFV